MWSLTLSQFVYSPYSIIQRFLTVEVEQPSFCLKCSFKHCRKVFMFFFYLKNTPKLFFLPTIGISKVQNILSEVLVPQLKQLRSQSAQCPIKWTNQFERLIYNYSGIKAIWKQINRGYKTHFLLPGVNISVRCAGSKLWMMRCAWAEGGAVINSNLRLSCSASASFDKQQRAELSSLKLCGEEKKTYTDLISPTPVESLWLLLFNIVHAWDF